MKRVKGLLKKKGWWIEASDAMEHLLYKDSSIPFLDDEPLLQQLFPKTDLKLSVNSQKKGRYTRVVGGKKIEESVFGQPKFKT
jgi:hypothetical protein